MLFPLAPQKRIASIFLLPDCDMSCRFCASEAGFATMARGEAEALLVALGGRGIRNVVLGGGEPCLWPHGLEGLCVFARDLGHLVQLNTNGLAVPPAFPRLPGVDRLILPVESAEPGVHDALRRRRGHHRVVMGRIEAALRSGVELTVSTVVTAENADAVEGIARWLGGLERRGARLHAWHLYNFLPVGRGGRPNADELLVPRERFLEVCDRAKGSGLGFPVYRRTHMLRSSSVEFFWMEDGELRIGGRGATSGGAAVEDGDVHPEACAGPPP